MTLTRSIREPCGGCLAAGTVLYRAHPYHTKVPHAIVPALHVLDGLRIIRVAAQRCGDGAGVVSALEGRWTPRAASFAFSPHSPNGARTDRPQRSGNEPSRPTRIPTAARGGQRLSSIRRQLDQRLAIRSAQCPLDEPVTYPRLKSAPEAKLPEDPNPRWGSAERLPPLDAKPGQARGHGRGGSGPGRRKQRFGSSKEPSEALPSFAAGPSTTSRRLGECGDQRALPGPNSSAPGTIARAGDRHPEPSAAGSRVRGRAMTLARTPSGGHR